MGQQPNRYYETARPGIQDDDLYIKTRSDCSPDAVRGQAGIDLSQAVTSLNLLRCDEFPTTRGCDCSAVGVPLCTRSFGGSPHPTACAGGITKETTLGALSFSCGCPPTPPPHYYCLLRAHAPESQITFSSWACLPGGAVAVSHKRGGAGVRAKSAMHTSSSSHTPRGVRADTTFPGGTIRHTHR